MMSAKRQDDKRDMARRIYGITPEREREGKKADLARILSVSERTVRDWLSRIDKDSKEARNRRIFDMWMACHTQEEIAEAENVDPKTVRDILGEMADLPKLPKSDQAAASHATDFDPPIYNIWKQQERTAGSKHFGNSEVRWLDNLQGGVERIALRGALGGADVLVAVLRAAEARFTIARAAAASQADYFREGHFSNSISGHE
jgi:DNA-binding CsgD family transcriptional regulator